MRRNWFEFAVIGFSLGVFFRSFIVFSFSTVLSFLLVAVSLLLFKIFATSRESATFFLLPLIIVSFVGGVARYELSEPTELLLNEYIGEKISAEGIVVKETDKRETLMFLTVDLDTIAGQGGQGKFNERIRIAVDRHEKFSYGDRIGVFGVVQEPENFETDTGRIFDYRSYLAKDGVYYEMFLPKVELIAHGEGNPVMSTLLIFKRAFLSKIERTIPEPESALMGGLILGEKRSLGDELTEEFRRSGLVHIIVLSGYNMTIVAKAIMASFSWFGKFLPAFFPPLAGILGIVAFTIMAGASATAVRAAIMALLVILSGILGRDYAIKRALAFAGVAMILHNPKILVFDPSFQLSFLATLGLIYLSPFFEKKFRSIPNWLGFREIVSATFATQLFVLPRLVDLSGTVSLVGVLANISVLPVIPITMLFGALTGFAGFIHDIVALPFAYLSYILLHYQVLMAQFFGNLPFSTIAVPVPPVWVLVGSYIALIWLVSRLRQLA